MRVAIDAGHGFANVRSGIYDPGVCYGDLTEADTVLAWALTLKWYLEQHGVETWLTRADDRAATPVGLRDDRAEQAQCTHFISLHCNGSANPSAQGTETFFRDGVDREWASKVHKAALDAMGLKDRGLKTEGQSQHTRLAVFDFKGPCCLLEVGFLSSTIDRAKILSRDCRIAFAEKLLEAIK